MKKIGGLKHFFGGPIRSPPLPVRPVGTPPITLCTLQLTFCTRAHQTRRNVSNNVVLARTADTRVHYFTYCTETESLLCPAKIRFKRSPKPAFPGNKNPIKRINRLIAPTITASSLCGRRRRRRLQGAPRFVTVFERKRLDRHDAPKTIFVFFLFSFFFPNYRDEISVFIYVLWRRTAVKTTCRVIRAQLEGAEGLQPRAPDIFWSPRGLILRLDDCKFKLF